MFSTRSLRHRVLAVPAAACLVLVLALPSSAYWSAPSVAGGSGSARASSINQGAQPSTIVTTSSVAVSWAATTRSDGGPVDGYIVKRYDAGTLAPQTPILAACSGVIAGTTCTENGVPSGTWRYTVTPVLGANWRGAESVMSATAMVDVTAPTNSITLNALSGSAFKNSNTVYYNSNATGSFTLSNALTDAGTGPASSATATLGGTTTGWSHSPTTVSTPSGGPYVSGVFSWLTSATGPATEVVTGRDVANNSAPTTLTFTSDTTPPTPGSLNYLDGNTPAKSVLVSFSSGIDAGSGIATWRLRRASAALVGGTCSGFSSFTDLGPLDPASPYTDTAVTNGSCYRYQYVVTDNVGNVGTTASGSVAMVDYAGAVNTTPGLLSQWRLGESITARDSMTGSDGTLLTAHAGEVGSSWTHAAGPVNSVLTGNRARRSSGGNYSWDYASAVPASADYSVEAHFTKVSQLTSDNVAVIARLDPATNSFYAGEYYNNPDGTIEYSISEYTNGAWAGQLTAPSPGNPLAVGATARLRLEVRGGATTLLKLYVDGVLHVTATDSTAPITAAGRAGILDGDPGIAVSKSATTGAHADNFSVTPLAADSRGTNHGQYDGAPALGAAGVLTGDADTSVAFDASNDSVRIPREVLSDFSVEFWFKSTQGANTGSQFYDGAALVNADSAAVGANDWGTSLRSDGRVVGGVGNPATSIVSATGGYNDGAWHHVVFTRNSTTGAMVLYVDGSSANGGTATGTTGIRDTTEDITFGRLSGSLQNLYAGHLDEVSLFGAVLTPTTVSNHYALGASAPGDSTGPTGGSVDASGLVGAGSRYSTSTNLSLTLSKGTDPSGVAPTGATLSRATATLTSVGGTSNGVCGSYGSYAPITGGTDPVSPKSDTVTDQACYRYRYIVQDTLGNMTTYTSPDVKVDSTGPSTPTYSFSDLVGAYWGGSGSTVYYRPGAGSGGFLATATSTDAASGIADATFPALGSGWASNPGAVGVTTYTWTGTPAVPGTVSATTTNNATVASAAGPFTVTADSTAPSAGTISYLNGPQGGTSVSVSFTTGTDAGSGVGTRLLQRAQATLTGSTCGAFGAFATVTGGTNPTSPHVDTVTNGNCYRYQYVVADNVGNTHTATSASVLKSSNACGTTQNVAVGRPATASTTYGSNAAANAFDGNTGSRWESAYADPQWISVDLGASKWICRVVLNWEAAAAESYKIQTSEDGSAWTDITSVTGSSGGLQTLTITGTGRYVRMYGMTRTTVWGYSLWEFEVYAGATGDVLLSQGQPTTASSEENPGLIAAYATDGDTMYCRWASEWGVDPQWLRLDLGQNANIRQVTLYWHASYATSFQVQTSDDAIIWTDVYSTATGTGGTQTLDVTGTGRYVRVLGTARATAGGYSLIEVKVFGTPAP